MSCFTHPPQVFLPLPLPLIPTNSRLCRPTLNHLHSYALHVQTISNSHAWQHHPHTHTGFPKGCKKPHYGFCPSEVFLTSMSTSLIDWLMKYALSIWILPGVSVTFACTLCPNWTDTLFCFANKFDNSENHSIKLYRSLEWWIVKLSWKFDWVLSTGSKDTLLTKNYDVISVAKYQFLWIFQELLCGSQVGLLDSIRVLQQHKHFPYTRCARHTNNMSFRLSSHPVVSSFAINRFNDAINIF